MVGGAIVQFAKGLFSHADGLWASADKRWWLVIGRQTPRYRIDRGAYLSRTKSNRNSGHAHRAALISDSSSRELRLLRGRALRNPAKRRVERGSRIAYASLLLCLRLETTQSCRVDLEGAGSLRRRGPRRRLRVVCHVRP